MTVFVNTMQRKVWPHDPFVVLLRLVANKTQVPFDDITLLEGGKQFLASNMSERLMEHNIMPDCQLFSPCSLPQTPKPLVTTIMSIFFFCFSRFTPSVVLSNINVA